MTRYTLYGALSNNISEAFIYDFCDDSFIIETEGYSGMRHVCELLYLMSLDSVILLEEYNA